MSISRIVLCLLLTLPVALLGQKATLNSAAGGTAAADETKDAPKLEHFDPTVVDKTLNPCDDFYKYACNKWLAANPIPPDQVDWGTGSGLEMWNDTALRETLEAAPTIPSAARGSRRSATIGPPAWTKAGLKRPA
jgi:predicted metalloendopeptidase